MEFDNFIGIFPNAFPADYCQNVIDYYEMLQKRDKIWDRRKSQPDVSPVMKQGSQAFLHFDPDTKIIERNLPIMQFFSEKVYECYLNYKEKYGVLSSVAEHSISNGIMVQKTKMTEGYHIWHPEQGDRDSSIRILAVQLYLNDVDVGGETEFLYQSKRVSAKRGTLLIHPAAFTHAHRGNPPLSGEKYTINSWIEFKE